MNLNTTHFVITGATGGIGQAIAQRLANEGLTLTLVGRNQAKLDSLLATLAGEHHAVCADLQTELGLQLVYETIKSNTGINALIHCAGASSFGQIDNLSNNHITSTIQLNLITPMLLDKSILPVFRERKQTCIIHVGSVFGSIGFPGFSAYCATKFGIRGYSEALQRESRSDEIDVRYFAPRATKTDFNSESVDELNSTLGNHVDTPAFVAEQFYRFLLSGKKRKVVGWPEKLFCRLNGLVPELVDKALTKHRKAVLDHTQTIPLKEVKQ
jgi:short-subunit dehydrogenase